MRLSDKIILISLLKMLVIFNISEIFLKFMAGAKTDFQVLLVNIS